jgi:hypothetical protein
VISEIGKSFQEDFQEFERNRILYSPFTFHLSWVVLRPRSLFLKTGDFAMPGVARINKHLSGEGSIDRQISSLPPAARREALDFIEFLAQKYQKKKGASAVSDKQYWQLLSEESLKKVWDNEEDDIYNELL